MSLPSPTAEYYADVKKDKVNLWGTFPGHPWLRLHGYTVGGMGLMRGWGTKILHAHSVQLKRKEKGLSCGAIKLRGGS